jgi:hypothetical protein
VFRGLFRLLFLCHTANFASPADEIEQRTN